MRVHDRMSSADAAGCPSGARRTPKVSRGWLRRGLLSGLAVAASLISVGASAGTITEFTGVGGIAVQGSASATAAGWVSDIRSAPFLDINSNTALVKSLGTDNFLNIGPFSGIRFYAGQNPDQSSTVQTFLTQNPPPGSSVTPGEAIVVVPNNASQSFQPTSLLGEDADTVTFFQFQGALDLFPAPFGADYVLRVNYDDAFALKLWAPGLNPLTGTPPTVTVSSPSAFGPNSCELTENNFNSSCFQNFYVDLGANPGGTWRYALSFGEIGAGSARLNAVLVPEPDTRSILGFGLLALLGLIGGARLRTGASHSLPTEHPGNVRLN